MLALLVVGLLLLGTACVLVVDAALAPARARRASLLRAAGYAEPSAPNLPQLPPLRERVVAPLLVWLARLALRMGPRTTLAHVRSRLLAAGLARRVSPTGFLAGKTLTSFAGAGLAVFLGASNGKPAMGIIMATIFGLVGLFAPEFALSKLAAARAERIAADLPKGIDLLAVSVEAGLGFDAAVAKVTARMDGPLVDELQIMLSEIRIGVSREQALRRLAERVPAREVGTFVQAVVQSELLGSSMGRILRTQADDLRRRRHVRAEEKAMKAPVKMLFPTVLFIFPALFIVILGPAFMTLLEIFS
jgi:tight adherence protein C